MSVLPAHLDVPSFVLGVLFPFAVWTVWVALVLVYDFARTFLVYRIPWERQRRYRFFEVAHERNAFAVTLPWWPRKGLVVRYRPWRRS